MKALTLTLLTFLSLTSLAAQTPARSGVGQTTTSTGVYWVPVDERELTEFSVFPVQNIEVRRRDSELKIKYPLPQELTGDLNVIEIEGQVPANGGPVALQGPLARASCPSADDLSHCAIHYENLKINSVARTDFLKQIVKSPTELELRERIAARFCVASTGGEPCGFLRVNENARRPNGRVETQY